MWFKLQFCPLKKQTPTKSLFAIMQEVKVLDIFRASCITVCMCCSSVGLTSMKGKTRPTVKLDSQ